MWQIQMQQKTFGGKIIFLDGDLDKLCQSHHKERGNKLLQVSRRSDGQWFSVKPNPDAFIINIGNCMQVWTNDKYWSAEHRVVVNSSKERFSMPFFLFPSHEVNIEPLKELISEDNPPCYKKYNWGKFYVARNRSDYKKLQTENIQIDRFKAA